MKKLKMFAALALALALAVPLQSMAADKRMGSSGPGGGGFHRNLSFWGSKVCRLSQTTTPVLCNASEGLLDGICLFGGASGNYAYAFDTVSAIIPTGAGGILSESGSYAISPKVFAPHSSGASFDTNTAACWAPPFGPVRFSSGLVGVTDAAALNVILYWHESDGTDP